MLRPENIHHSRNKIYRYEQLSNKQKENGEENNLNFNCIKLTFLQQLSLFPQVVS